MHKYNIRIQRIIMQRINSESKIDEGLFLHQLQNEAPEEQDMDRAEDIKQEQNIDLEDSPHMNQFQLANFAYIRSKSSDSQKAEELLSRLLPHLGDLPKRSLVIEPPQNQITSNIIISSPQEYHKDNLHVFKKIKKTKIRGKCDYDKNICGYITKKVIRQFVGRHYQREGRQFTERFNCDYEQCKAYYTKRVQMVTGPSHLPELFNAAIGEDSTITNSKLAFRQFYRWFIRQRYLRYLLLQGKMTNKQAYIEYKNTHLFKYVQPVEQEQPQMRMRTRSFSSAKLE